MIQVIQRSLKDKIVAGRGVEVKNYGFRSRVRDYRTGSFPARKSPFSGARPVVHAREGWRRPGGFGAVEGIGSEAQS